MPVPVDMVSDQNDFNNHAYRRFMERIKVRSLTPNALSRFACRLRREQDSLDPNGILSPGKMGIWPQKYRHLRDTQHATQSSSSASKL